MDLTFEIRTAITLVTACISLFLMYFVTRYGKTPTVKYLFALANVGLLGWMLSIYVPFHPAYYEYATISSRFGLLSGVIMSYSIFLLVFYLSRARLPSNFFLILLSVISLFIVLPLCLTPYFFISTTINNDEAITQTGPLIFIYALYAFFIFFSSVYVLIQAHRHAQGEFRKQITWLLYGILGMLGGIIFALMLPVVLFGSARLVPVGALFVLFFLFIVSVAIARYGLFNIRLVSVQILVFILNLLLIFQMFIPRNLNSLRLNILVFIIAMITSYLFIVTAKRESKLEMELTRLAALEEANAKLKSLDEQKTSFFTLAAHQLRTPLSVIGGYMELIKDGAYGKASGELLKILDHVTENNTHLVNLVDQFLKISKLEQGQVQFTFVKEDFVSFIKKIVPPLRSLASQKKLKIALKIAPDKLMAAFDKEKIQQVVENIVDNAVRYSERGTITITVTAEEDGVSCSVNDEGLGFESLDKESLFQKFFRGSNVKTIEVNGTGLGLYIAKKFIEGHHGRVWGRSEGVGKGSEFGFWIPNNQV